MLDQIFSLLSSAWKNDDTYKELSKIGRYYPNMVKQFCDWLERYTDSKNENYLNRTIFDITKERDYYKAIITYMSGMTDKFAIDTYNEIISF